MKKLALENSGFNLNIPVGNKTKIGITAELYEYLPHILINTATKCFGLAVLLHGNTE